MDTSLHGDVSHTILGQVILPYDLVSRIIMSGAYLLYLLMQESQIWYVDSSWDDGVVLSILGHFELDIDCWPHF